ncbi:MAG TPA: hypothetical protein VHS96_01715 [Bacteroidia bacterium]|nr:hypothetical protein [Bacteroidia bacterium]
MKIRAVSVAAYEHIDRILRTSGAITAQEAIEAVRVALIAVFEALEEEQSNGEDVNND